MSDTKSNPYTLIAGFLLPWKVTKNSTRKEQPNNNKKPCAWILPVLQCLQNPTRFITLPGKILAKSHKFKKSKTFRLFEFFDFFDFSTFRMFRFFRLFEQKSPGMWTFRLFAVKKRDFHGVTATSQKSTQLSWNYPPQWSQITWPPRKTFSPAWRERMGEEEQVSGTKNLGRKGPEKA